MSALPQAIGWRWGTNGAGKSTLPKILAAAAQADRLLIENLQLHIAWGDRLTIAGANGTGKSSLAKAVLQMSSTQAYLTGGEWFLSSAMNVVYLDIGNSA